ncbi:hypothetical protein G5I_10115 [Acromyrmex echinatior]|uniref:Uncharacterized protein n=1 Tax=Acromyrmex echinatior TaxID=103372 RepID=F4WW81_ACREC|nr:hypothetical protein G5I_10115 [Acromyrmex echinatior]
MQRWAKDEAAVQKAREGGGGGQEGRLGLERGGPGGEGGGEGGREAKTLRRSIPSLRATRFRSPAAFMHQERGQRDGATDRKSEKDGEKEKEKESRDNCGLRVRERVPFAGSAVPQDPKSIMWLYGTSVRDAAQ